MHTGFAAARLGIIAYIVPFLFIYFPGLLFEGSASHIIMAVATALLGCFALSAALSGFLYKRVKFGIRVLLLLAGVALMIPVHMHERIFSVTLLVNLLGGITVLLLIFLEWLDSKKDQRGHLEPQRSSSIV